VQFNAAAARLVARTGELEQRSNNLYTADSRLFMTKSQARRLAPPPSDGRRTYRLGEVVVCNDGFRRKITNGVGKMHAYEGNEHGSIEVHFPCGRGYRITALLDLLKQMVEQHDEIAHDDLFLVTVSGEMMREGVSLCTSDRDYKLTAMTVVGQLHVIVLWCFVRMIQILGRVCGYGFDPTLYVPRSLNERHTLALRVEDILLQCVEEGGRNGLNPRDSIIAADTGLANLARNTRLVRGSAQPEHAIEWIRADSQSLGYELRARTTQNPRTPEQIMTGIHGYHRLLRELFYRPENGVSEALFRRIVGVTGPRFLITSNLNSCGISPDTTRRQTGGLLWDRGAANQQRALVEGDNGDRHFPIVRRQNNSQYSLNPYMRQVAEQLQNESRLPIRESHVAAMNESNASILGRRQRDEAEEDEADDERPTCQTCENYRPLLPCPNPLCTYFMCQQCLDRNRGYNRHTCPACTLRR
jgi:hypothetical protein